MFKFIKYTFYSLLFLLVAFIIFLQTPSVKEYAIQEIQKVVEEKSGQKIEIEEIFLYLPFYVSAKGVRVIDKEDTWLSVDRVKVGLSLFITFTEGYTHFHQLKLDGVKLKEPPSFESDPNSAFSRIEVDALTILNFQFEESEPVDLRGNIFFRPEIESITANLRLNRSSNKKQVVQALLSFVKNRGKFRVEVPSTSTLEGEFTLPEQGIIDITNIRSTTGPISIEGNLAVDENCEFSKAKFKIESGELSKLLPIKGKVSGEARLKGHISQPILNLKMSSDQISIHHQTFEQVHIAISSHPLAKGIGGKVSLNFLKEKHAYHFSGSMDWDTPFSPKFMATLKLAETLELLDIDTSNIKGDLEVSVDLSSSAPLAEFKIVNGSYESYDLGFQFRDIQGDLAIEESTLLITKLSGKDQQKGTISGTGKMKFSEEGFPFSINFDVNQVLLIDLDNFKTQGSGNLELVGNAKEATLGGSLTTDSLLFNLPEKSKAITDSLNITYINQPENEPPPTTFQKKKLDWPLYFNIDVRARKNTFIRGSGLNSEWTGKAAIKGKAGELLVNGEMKIREGTFIFRGKKFVLNKGTITFDGDLEKKTTLYVIAALEIDKLTAEVLVKGPVRNPKISFRSNPPKSQREILSWILFNKGLNEISDFQGTQLNDSITDLLKSSDSSPDILSRFQNSLGIDRLEISGASEGESDGMTVQVGKYLSNNTFLTFKRKTSQDTNRTTEENSVGIETTLFKDFKLQAEVDDDGNGQANILWRRDY